MNGQFPGPQLNLHYGDTVEVQGFFNYGIMTTLTYKVLRSKFPSSGSYSPLSWYRVCYTGIASQSVSSNIL
jgi:hypothetical protein